MTGTDITQTLLWHYCMIVTAMITAVHKQITVKFQEIFTYHYYKSICNIYRFNLPGTFQYKYHNTN